MTIQYLHFCGGFGQQAGLPLRFWELLAIEAAAKLHPKAKLMIHTSAGSWDNMPSYATRIDYSEAESRQWSTWTCQHGAHVSDRVRLLALLKYGGLYQDTDSFTLRNCDELAKLDVCGIPGMSRNLSIINGFIYAKPNDPWLKAVYDRVDGFGGAKTWADSSVKLYSKLRKEIPGCKALPYQKYTCATWHQWDAEFLFGQLTEQSRARADAASAFHAIHTGLSYAEKTYNMDNPPEGSTYAYVLSKCKAIVQSSQKLL